MNNVLFRLVALISGLLFGLGMTISGMADPAKVIGFLDVAGNWDPSLMFVMGGALLVFMPAYFLLIKPKTKPLNAEEFCLSNSKKIDTKLLLGAAIFGLGWGIAGVCPGPAVSSLALGNSDVVIFTFAMMLGLGSTHFILNKNT
ncbi:YeeE/YedE family protein [Aliivibrio sp. EL58]|uniref:YeeE/YedE family protein n=1 Tax=Aliivibrio sp. EL58 TaxID=2107582 RepID=UPI000EFAC9F3|nr:YeeE/YedE family protein [Aliivibrio sp. EL58]